MKPGADTAAVEAKRAFWDETAKGIANVLTNVGSTWYNNATTTTTTNNGDTNNNMTAAVYYSRERQNLEKYITPFQYGLGATVFLFLNFRITGSQRFQRWSQEWMRMRKANRGPPKTPSSSSSPHQQPHQQQHQQQQLGYLESKRQREVQAALSSMKVITDLLISVSVGTSGALFILEAEKDTMRQDFEEAPLVAGRSVVADQVCSEMIAIANQYPKANSVFLKRDDTTTTTDDDADPTMKTFAKFVSNCRLRQDYEAKARIRQGKAKNEPIIIPHPGLSGR
jgi:hypothetical protein